MVDDENLSAEPPEEPEVADWARPTLEETQLLLRRDPEEIAHLAVRHPGLARFLSLGFDAVREVWSGEQAATAKIGEAYFSLTQGTIEGLLKRLDQDNVGDEERATIYRLIKRLQNQSSTKTSELLEVNAKSGEKTRLLMGTLILLGLAVTAGVYLRRGSHPPSIGG